MKIRWKRCTSSSTLRHVVVISLIFLQFCIISTTSHENDGQSPNSILQNPHRHEMEEKNFKTPTMDVHRRRHGNHTEPRVYCLGTKNGRNRIAHNTKHAYNHYQNLKSLFQNCKRIIGNLEITHINNTHLLNDETEEFQLPNGTIAIRKKKPFWFLENLEQISGYLLIYGVEIEQIDLPNLKIIWGRKLYDDEYSLAVENSRNLSYLNMPKFRSIENGRVKLRRLSSFCYLEKIDFGEFFGKSYSEDKLNISKIGTECGETPVCDESCNGFCYGPDPDMCQDIYRHHCSPECASGMCLKDADGKETCCDQKCTAGCYGSGPSMCVGCKDFEQDKECVDRCRGTHGYDHINRRKYELPDDEKRYTFEKHCDKKCPTDTLIEGETCVERCSEGFYQEPGKKECSECKGACPKECVVDYHITSKNVHRLKNCTRITGNIEILTHAWGEHMDMETREKVRGLTVEDLNALKDITFVSGYINIEGGYKSLMRSLDFLSNLEYIEGLKNHYSYTLHVVANQYLEYLGLKNLKQITHGHVAILKNEHLCYVYTLNWKRLMKESQNFKVTFRENEPEDSCENRGRICDSTCAQEEGCWGPGPDMCLKCKTYIKDDACANHCPIHEGYFINKTAPTNADPNPPRRCERCHEHCNKCTGPDPANCTECKPHAFTLNVEGENPLCLAKCPEDDTYPNGKVCTKCHEACLPFGCSGPHSHLGQGGCNRCKYGVYHGNEIRCLTSQDRDSALVCQDNGLLHHYVRLPYKGEFDKVFLGVCSECRDECSNCTQHGDDFGECHCKHYRVKASDNFMDTDKCVMECPENTYLIENKTETDYGVCRKCHSFCADHMSCSGPEAIHCDHCKNAGVMAEGVMICLDACPIDKPYVYSVDGLCYNYDKEYAENVKRTVIKVVIVFAVLAFVIIVASLGLYLKKFRTKYRHEKAMHLPEIPEYDKNSIIKKPNMNQIHLITIDDLIMPTPQKVLGEGAFGVVFAGKYKIPGKKITIPVAIKAINVGSIVDGSVHVKTGNTEAEMIEEAGIMAKLHHEHLLRLVGICFAKGVKIVTLLRPLGPLNKFLMRHHDSLGARNLMLYCYQISSAMEYLAKHKIVHCDLAARNVLMRKIDHVEVTDFGLARILEGANPTSTINNKIPVKWMPIECLANRRNAIYSEATDVWSFGVTCWEILTYGEMPYKNVILPVGRDQCESLLQYLDNGGRLKQPSNCSQELYQLFLQCWATSPESRPRFKSLKETLMQYNRAPHQFVQDRQITQRMDSMTDSEQQQRRLIEDLLRDSDFNDTMGDELSNYLNQSQTNMTNMTMETDLPPSPTSPSRPLMGSRHTRLSSTGTNSTRYKSEPGGKRQLSVTTENMLDEEITDEENYLVPKSGPQQTEPLDEDNDQTLYTPIIAKTMDYENNELPEDKYLNAVVTGNYYKLPENGQPAPPRSGSNSPPKKRLAKQDQLPEYVNAETSV